jgi:hypothetical protein
MIPEGNGRNYCSCLALARCHDLNFFLDKPLGPKKALPEPNLSYLSRHITCQYVVHRHDQLKAMSVDYPYSKQVQRGYLNLSQKSYKNSSSSQKLTYHNFGMTYFRNNINPKINVDHEITPLEIRTVWPDEFKTVCESFFVSAEKGNWADIAIKYWLKLKKASFFKELEQCHDLLTLFKRDFNHAMKQYFEKEGVDNTSRAFMQFLILSMEDNIRSDYFQQMNFIRFMSLYLCGLACYSSNSRDSSELMAEMQKVITLNGVAKLVLDPLQDSRPHFCRTLQCAWLPIKSRTEGTNQDIYAVRY